MIRAALALALLAAASQEAPDDRATFAAKALLAADGTATPAADRRAALVMLDRLGVHPASGVDDPLPAWRTRTGVAGEAMRGRLLGPAFHHGAVAPRQAWSVAQTFLAGRPATVAIASDPQGATALAIAGPDTAVRCADRARCRWVPRFTERYVITISNAGLAPARFFLVTD